MVSVFEKWVLSFYSGFGSVLWVHKNLRVFPFFFWMLWLFFSKSFFTVFIFPLLVSTSSGTRYLFAPRPFHTRIVACCPKRADQRQTLPIAINKKKPKKTLKDLNDSGIRRWKKLSRLNELSLIPRKSDQISLNLIEPCLTQVKVK